MRSIKTLKISSNYEKYNKTCSMRYYKNQS